ncbi:aminoglycoside phosphotransferase family protein [Emticicia fluvialis]|uniref:aminoglycoside phosphotransferase family protein n=1 Tax=Emticicia fluvialis TaxID=2974474 RepID=UPI0021652ACF|nr:aminoglycoside phosphotransferase family protein [Emticicia fluvialis]
MLLTAYNLTGYLLQQNTHGGFSALSNIFSERDLLLIENIDARNPRNTLLKCTVNKQSFVFKQPKFLTNSGTLPILNEYHFYSSFGGLQVKLKDFSFDSQYNILLLPYLQNLPEPHQVLNSSCQLQEYARQTADALAALHQSLRLNGNPPAKVFLQNHCFNRLSYYKSFINLLQLGATRAQFLDEVVFPSFAFISPSRAILHNFLNKATFSDALEEFSEQIVEEYLIHGDLKVENLLQDGATGMPKFIDFENVSEGDHAWDFACFLESVLYQPAFRRGASTNELSASLMKRYFFFAEYLNAYCQKFSFNETAHYQFTSRVLKFWAIRKLERLRNYDGNFNYFLVSLEVVKRLMIDTDKYIDAIYDSGECRFEIFEF